MDNNMKFITKGILAESNIICGISRVEAAFQEGGSTNSLRNLLMELYGKISKLEIDQESEWHRELLLAVVHMYQGSLSIDLRELPNAENELKIALTSRALSCLNSTSINIFLKINNELGSLWLERHEDDLAKAAFVKSDQAAKEYFKQREEPYGIKDLFHPLISEMPPSGRHQLYDLHNEALAQLSFLKEKGERSETLLLHRSLESSLISGEAGSQQQDIALNLLRFFIKTRKFLLGRQYLAAIDYIEEVIQNKKRKVTVGHAEYYARLLTSCVEKFQERKRVLIQPKQIQDEDNLYLLNSSLKHKLRDYEGRYHGEPGREYVDTRPIFILGRNLTQDYLKTIEFGVEEGSVEVNQALSHMYKCLSVFMYEKIGNIEFLNKVAKLQKRRIRILENTVQNMKKFDQREKLTEVLEELGDLYMEMLELKQKKFERTAGNLEPRLLQKLAYLSLLGVRHYKTVLEAESQAYLCTEVPESTHQIIQQICEAENIFPQQFIGSPLTQVPKSYPDEVAKDAVKAIYTIGRFYNKVFTPIRKDQMQFTNLAILYYRLVVDYCSRNSQQSRLLSYEYNQSINSADLLQRQVRMQEEAEKQTATPENQ